jgi:hypothetical protein
MQIRDSSPAGGTNNIENDMGKSTSISHYIRTYLLYSKGRGIFIAMCAAMMRVNNQ